MTLRWFASLLPKYFVASAVVLLVGCGKDELQLVPVTGTLTVAGKPLPTAGISLQADAAKGNTTPHIAAALTDQQGRFELMTTNRKGALPGWYKIVIQPPLGEPGPGGMPLPFKELPYNKKYADPKTTDLSIEVKPGAPPGTYDIDLKK